MKHLVVYYGALYGYVNSAVRILRVGIFQCFCV